jgi:aminocarboxymuconate-semialdehyde decarboxylase
VLIDIHTHVIPSEFPPVGRRAAGGYWPRIEPVPGGGVQLVTTPTGRGFVTSAISWDLDERRKAMQTHGVDAEVLSPMPGLFGYDLEPQDGLDLCGYINDFVAGLCAAEPHHFYGLGIVPLQDVALATAELARLKERGLLGVQVASNVKGNSLGEERFLEFFVEAERLSLAVYVHGMTPTFAERMPANALPTFGLGAELIVTAASLIGGDLLERCPTLRIALSHGGGGFPFVLPRADFFWGGTWNEEPSTAAGPGPKWSAQLPSERGRRLFYDTLVFDWRALRYLVDKLGTDRLMVGTDHPFMLRERPVGKTLRSLGLSQADIDNITWATSLTWLGVQPPPATDEVQPIGATHA